MSMEIFYFNFRRRSVFRSLWAIHESLGVDQEMANTSNRFRKFHLQSVGMDCLCRHIQRCHASRRHAKVAMSRFRKRVLIAGIETLKAQYENYHENIVNIKLAHHLWERKRFYAFLKCLGSQVKDSYLDSVSQCKSIIFWKIRRQEITLKLLKGHCNLRIKKRDMLRRAQAEFHSNMKSLLCAKYYIP